MQDILKNSAKFQYILLILSQFYKSSSHTCATKDQDHLVSLFHWDLSAYQICILTGAACAAGNPTSFVASSCYSNSPITYSWSANSQSNTACISQTTPNMTNNTVNNTNNTYGQIISIILAIALIIQK